MLLVMVVPHCYLHLLQLLLSLQQQLHNRDDKSQGFPTSRHLQSCAALMGWQNNANSLATISDHINDDDNELITHLFCVIDKKRTYRLSSHIFVTHE